MTLFVIKSNQVPAAFDVIRRLPVAGDRYEHLSAQRGKPYR